MSSNPFDIIGARFVGWNAAWMQRDKKIVFDLLDVRFGSLAVIQTNTSLMSAIGRIADTRQCDFESPRLYVRFQLKRSSRGLYFTHAHRLLSANSGRSRDAKILLLMNGIDFIPIECGSFSLRVLSSTAGSPKHVT